MSMNPNPSLYSRRGFLSTTLGTAGAGLVLAAPNILRAAETGGSDAIHVALVGFGKQGEKFCIHAAGAHVPAKFHRA